MLPPYSRRVFITQASVLAAAAASPMRLFGTTPPPPTKIILDVDLGIDDAFALLLAHYSPAIDLVGITTCFGNTTIDKGTRNCLYMKEKFGIKAEVYRGAAEPLLHAIGEPPAFVHGEDGLGDIEKSIEPTILEADLSAPEFIVQTIMDNPGEITVVSVGPFTNLMMARILEPAIVSNVKQVVLMGGAGGFAGEQGNITTVAEANAWNDPHAMDSLFKFDWPVVMVGLDVTYTADGSMDQAYLDRLAKTAGEPGAFLERINRYYMKFYEQSRGVSATFQHDSIAVAYVIDPSLFEVRRGKVKVLTDGVARGQTVFCPEGHHTFGDPDWAGLPTQSVCSKLNGPGFLYLYEKTLVNAQS